ncbi:MAG: hypothetical protein COW04_07495 [Deltaproteobacteria bacterium CG12_big_fil_rev_8_21_14_0_65_43_10]|nr:MAG: hypothetical protein AUK23_06675 [Deltaproteobacteria bacterium CG2_30_43_15]PIQ45472.1 MAG: hypothetical protein COW04_07495 [Deltaproteobacteria bacterium CG12_big_fil_rev_8_21_14_0_65_43_10]PIU85175.1 MAG: hypothetical protein COS67_09295 [Deltaproteobacteria bacterium CG06_land_8_20_14_3_00_44_19]PIX21929.1 MAG: hypothetical protein COZ68_13605 [Deltaproteobacteria bacterium CG_4_8_14_3_um_filter_43_13]PIZ18589.1 MAG: hypothetical protein COY50_14540 [Deltaproteobacteria bacterium C
MGLKLDLHTHCYEATLSTDVDAIKKIVNAVKARNLDGVAITEHIDKDYGYRVKEIVEEHFDNAILIIPGQEMNTDLLHVQVVELYISDNTIFRFVAHPYHVTDFSRYVAAHADELHGVEIENFQHRWEMNQIDKHRIQAIAVEHGLMLLTNSDAHSLDDIGRYYNEVDLEELYMRIAQKRCQDTSNER